MISDKLSLNGKTILVTGATGDIGRQIAITLSEHGATMIITGRNEEKLKQTNSLLHGNNHTLIIADLTIENDINELAEKCFKLDGIVYSAAVIDMFPTKFINRKRIETTFLTNFYGPVLLMTALFKYKKINTEASITFISSFASKYPYTTGALYSASKSAIESYSKVLTAEHRNIKLRSNCVSPAIIQSKVFEDTKTFIDSISSKTNEIEKKYLLGFGSPEDVSNLVLFLQSNASKWITGQNYILDGGFLRGLMS